MPQPPNSDPASDFTLSSAQPCGAGGGERTRRAVTLPFSGRSRPAAAPDETTALSVWGHAPPAPLKGRGTSAQPQVRFDHWERIAEPAVIFDPAVVPGIRDDMEYSSETTRSPATTITVRSARSIISRNQSPDIPFDRSINPYQGCEHGCVYCFARPSHAYLGLSPGLDFETRIFAKENAATLLRQALTRPGYRAEPLALGANTDPYQPAERELRLTRAVLEVLLETRHPVMITTKSALVTRDLDLLTAMAAQRLVHVNISVTSLDRDLARILEPRAPTAVRRLQALAQLSAAGIPTSVFFAPVIPVINDHDLEKVLAAGREAGAVGAGYVNLRLPLELQALFRQWLDTHYPLRADHVMSRIMQMRDGRANDSRFGTRMRGTGLFADLLNQRFTLACHRLGLTNRPMSLETGQFEPPKTPADITSPQLDLW